MSLSLKYKGIDITSSVDIKQCIHESFAEQHGDTVMLKFSNSKKLWDKWSPATGDELEIASGNAKSGKMFIKEIEPLAGYFILRASSLPQSTEVVYSRAWEGITFLQLGKDIANRHSLRFKTYGIIDRKYAYLRQSAQTDLNFFEDICVLEGSAFLIYDGSLIVYNEEYIESKNPVASITISEENRFRYEEQMKYSGCTINNGAISHTYLRDDSYGYVEEKTLTIYIDSKAEAERFAKNMFRYLNKSKKKGYFYSKPIADSFSAGSILKISTEAAQSYNGSIFITRIRHDYINGKSKIFFRVPLEG